MKSLQKCSVLAEAQPLTVICAALGMQATLYELWGKNIARGSPYPQENKQKASTCMTWRGKSEVISSDLLRPHNVMLPKPFCYSSLRAAL